MYSEDVKKIAIRLYNKFSSLRIVSKLLQCSHSTISRWKNFKNKISRKKINTKLGSKQISDFINLYMISYPMCFIKDIKQEIYKEFNLEVSLELIRLYIIKSGFTRKKIKYYSETKNYEEKLKDFLNLRSKYIKENRKFVSIDETSFGRNCLMPYGRSKKGEKLFVKANNHKIKNTSVLTSISIGDDMKFIKQNKPFNSESFYNFINNLDYPENTVIIMDNVSFHHSKKVKDLIKNKNWNILYTVPYCPIFNPIEGVFSVVKHHYKKINSIEESFNNVTQEHIISFFKYSFDATNFKR